MDVVGYNCTRFSLPDEAPFGARSGKTFVPSSEVSSCFELFSPALLPGRMYHYLEVLINQGRFPLYHCRPHSYRPAGHLSMSLEVSNSASRPLILPHQRLDPTPRVLPVDPPTRPRLVLRHPPLEPTTFILLPATARPTRSICKSSSAPPQPALPSSPAHFLLHLIPVSS